MFSSTFEKKKIVKGVGIIFKVGEIIMDFLSLLFYGHFEKKVVERKFRTIIIVEDF